MPTSSSEPRRDGRVRPDTVAPGGDHHILDYGGHIHELAEALVDTLHIGVEESQIFDSDAEENIVR